jgi:putative NIF3 family GTP cyclohydrolase 1 type 2
VLVSLTASFEEASAMTSITRRSFSKGVCATLLAPIGFGSAQAALRGAPTAEEVVARMKAKVAGEGVAWIAPGTDTFKYGDPKTPVHGIVTTFQATFDVLKRAAAAKKNFILTHERMFWDFIDDIRTLKQDEPFYAADALENDPVFVAKRTFCEENGLVVYRFHDNWHRGWTIGRSDGTSSRLDPIFSGLNARLGWAKYFQRMPGGLVQCGYQIPPTRLRDVARHLRERLDTGDVRVVGDPDLMVERIGDGAHQLKENLDRLRDSDVLLLGETEEFDMFHYVRDSISLGTGRPKGLIVITHERYEEWGMEIAPQWISPLVPGIPVEHISAGNPYWVLPQTKS